MEILLQLAQLFNELGTRGILFALVIFGILGLFFCILGVIPTSPPVIIEKRRALGCFSGVLFIGGMIGFMIPLMSSTFIAVGQTLPTSIPAILQPTDIPQNSGSSSTDCPQDAYFANPLSPDGRIYNVGTGVLGNVARPNGYTTPLVRTVREMLNQHNCIQNLVESVPASTGTLERCIISAYNTNRIWFGATTAGTIIQIRKVNSDQFVVIGQLNTIAPDSIAYIFEYSLNVGDEICVVNPPDSLAPPTNFHLRIGSDLKKIMDSWCLLDNDTDNSEPYRNYCV